MNPLYIYTDTPTRGLIDPEDHEAKLIRPNRLFRWYFLFYLFSRRNPGG